MSEDQQKAVQALVEHGWREFVYNRDYLAEEFRAVFAHAIEEALAQVRAEGDAAGYARGRREMREEAMTAAQDVWYKRKRSSEATAFDAYMAIRALRALPETKDTAGTMGTVSV